MISKFLHRNEKRYQQGKTRYRASDRGPAVEIRDIFPVRDRISGGNRRGNGLRDFQTGFSRDEARKLQKGDRRG